MIAWLKYLALNGIWCILFFSDYSFLCAPLCTAKQRKTHRLSLKVSNAYKPFLVLPNMQRLVVQNYLALDGHITKDAYFVLGRVNVSLSNVAFFLSLYSAFCLFTIVKPPTFHSFFQPWNRFARFRYF